MKKLFVEIRKMASIAIFVSSSSAFAQVGINTDSPVSTFDVQVKNPNDSQSLEGIIAPRLLGSQLSAKIYTVGQTGAIVYITDATATLTGQTINVTSAGYYYFDGTVWRRMLTTIANNSWILADTALSSKINSPQGLLVYTGSDGPYEIVSTTTLTVNVPAGYSQNKVVVRWDIWGDTTSSASPSQGSLRYAVRQQRAGNTAIDITNIMMSGWVNNTTGTVARGPRWNAPVVYTINNLAPGTYNFDLLVHRETELNTSTVTLWGAQGKGDVYVK